MERSDAIARLRAHRERLREAGVRALYLFGSVALGTAHADSDVDLFVDPDYDCSDFVALFRTESFLASVLGRPVDLLTRDGLHPALRSAVERDAVRVI